MRGDGREQKLVEVISTSGRDSNLLGYNAECSCVAIEGLPVAISAAGRATLLLTAKSDVDRVVRISLFSDDPKQARLNFEVRVSGATAATSSSSARSGN